MNQCYVCRYRNSSCQYKTTLQLAYNKLPLHSPISIKCDHFKAIEIPKKIYKGV